ncbi:recombinase family protein [Aureliella helgolandensis]|uniref:DNA-invertase hin n=1 Tax=Aureliella helgolandensis TaxID=2527968 RepID=A0A518GBF8_9BACT|nr:recombinase family protein [Aureliella helgolandensis]QDV25961.1 DNA-invertase hin [Aureliella helgolandensis]
MSRRTKEKPPARDVVRCAIYTRKSTEEGLEQEFNSLDAQREAGEAYIKSQQHEGWVCVPDAYDDGGFTGANMERPALRRLLCDIEEGKVDCVVVYKVDRLSRNLMDFGRIIEILDRHNVAFVSVTQSFNTSTSMGRLILNVLLSFAQFEREMISERTRDKIAAARRKGKWSGGMPVLGYDVANTKLVVDECEAGRVREIFRLYLDQQSLLDVAKEINAKGWRTKRWVTKKSEVRGGKLFDKGSLHRLLTNVVYVGKLTYKTEVHEGEHEAIVDLESFNQAQALLERNGRSGGREVRNKHNALLRGLMHCGACDCGMSHSYSKKGSKLYRYYVCHRAQKRGWEECPAPSLPAGEIERFVVDQIKRIGRDPALIRTTLAQVQRQTDEELRRLAAEKTALARDVRQDYVEVGRLAGTALAGDPRLLEVQTRIREAERRMTVIGEELASLKSQAIDEKDVAASLGEFDSIWEALAPREQARVLELLIERVTYDADTSTLSITYRPTGIKSLAKQGIDRIEEAA